MSDMRHDDRLFDLLAARATEGLSPVEAAELRALLAAAPDIGEDDLDLAAAAAALAFASAAATDETMPAELRSRIVADGTARLSIGRASVSTTVAENTVAFRPPQQPRGGRSGTLGWLAAAAMFLVAVLGWMRQTAPTTPSAPGEPPLAEQVEKLLTARPDAIRVAWAPSEDPEFAEVEGEVLWSTAAQAGFMRLRGMPANDPAERQYQLWVVDPERDAEPVDGGVFDIPPGGGEVIVPIDVKLAVGSPTVFAITVEQPGGVVVSEGPLRLVAPVTS